MCELKKLMAEPLPKKTLQRQRPFRPGSDQVQFTYDLINRKIFDNALSMPTMHLRSCHHVWGQCCVWDDLDPDTNSRCEIFVNPYWFCQQWFITTLAHEMVHQFQWDVIGDLHVREGQERDVDHGPSFFYFVPIFEKFNIPLKEVYSDRDWFKHQNLFLC